MCESEDLLRRIMLRGTSYVPGTAALKRLRRHIYAAAFFMAGTRAETLLIIKRKETKHDEKSTACRELRHHL